MTQPPDHHHQGPQEPEQTTNSDPQTRLDQRPHGEGPWTVDDVDSDNRTTSTTVIVPHQPPELHPDAAFALLKLLQRLTDHNANSRKQEP